MRGFLVGLGAMAGLLAFLPAACAQEQEVEPSLPGPPGCEDYEQYRQFDFWLGQWNVYTREGRFAGQNTVSNRSGGCLLLEEWVSARGGNGTSMNYVDPETGQWRQVWMGVNNHIDYTGGLNADGQMVLEGEITYFREDSARSAPFRGIWTPLDNGHVIQHFQQYDAEAVAWEDWFLATYVPVGDDPNGPDPGEHATGPVLETAPMVVFE